MSHETGKAESDVERYFDAFLELAPTHLLDYSKVIDKVERGEKKIARQTEISDALAVKVARAGPTAFQTLTVSVPLLGIL